MGLTRKFTLVAVGLLLFVIPEQGFVANEWFVRALEAKAVAYGLILIAIGLLLSGRYLWMALLLGLATSFHVAVGGWAFLAVAGWLLLRGRAHLKSIRQAGLLIVIYLVASGFAIGQVLDQVATTMPVGEISPSYIYTFIRLPHHLNPRAWSNSWWLAAVWYLVGLEVSLLLLRWRQRNQPQPEFFQAQQSLAELTVVALIPFLLGVAIARFDNQGKFLQFYPFRLADVLLPLTTCLLGTCALQQLCAGRVRRMVAWVGMAWLAWECSQQAGVFGRQLLALHEIPRIHPQSQIVCEWVRTQTSRAAIVITPPVELLEFSWLAERPTIAKFKFLPQNRTAILEWYERLNDLSGDTNPWQVVHRSKDRRSRVERRLTQGYRNLTTEQVQALMTKYQASYFLDRASHQLNLPVAYQSDRYIIYRRKPPV